MAHIASLSGLRRRAIKRGCMLPRFPLFLESEGFSTKQRTDMAASLLSPQKQCFSRFEEDER